MSVQDIIASQTFGQDSVNTVQKILELQGQNARNTQNMLTQVRGQDLEQQANQANNATAQQRNAIEMLQDQRKYETDQARLGIEQEQLGINQQNADSNKLNVFLDHQRGLAQLGINQQAVDVNKSEFALKQAQELIKQQKEQALAEGFQQGGLEGGMQVAMGLGMTKEGLKMAEILNTMERSGYQNLRDKTYIESEQEKITRYRDGITMAQDIGGLRSMTPGAEKDAKLLEYGAKYGIDSKDPQVINGALNAIARAKIDGFQNESANVVMGALGPDNPQAKNMQQSLSDTAAAESKGKQAAELEVMGIKDKQAELDKKVMANTELSTKADDLLNEARKNKAFFANGRFAKLGLEATRFFESLGIMDPNSSSPGLLMKAFNMQLALGSRITGTGAMSDRELEGYQASVAGLEWSLPAIEKFAEFKRIAMHRARAQASFYKSWVVKNKNDLGADEAWVAFINDNPIRGADGKINMRNVSNYQKYLNMTQEEANQAMMDSLARQQEAEQQANNPAQGGQQSPGQYSPALVTAAQQELARRRGK